MSFRDIVLGHLFLPIFQCLFILIVCHVSCSYTHTHTHAHTSVQASFWVSKLCWCGPSVSVNGFVVSHLHPAPWCSFYISLWEDASNLPPSNTSTPNTHTHTHTHTHRRGDREFCQPTSLFLPLLTWRTQTKTFPVPLRYMSEVFSVTSISLAERFHLPPAHTHTHTHTHRHTATGGTEKNLSLIWLNKWKRKSNWSWMKTF